MRWITYTDKHGRKHRTRVRDGDPDEAAPLGLLYDPPDLERLDWEGVKTDLHNALVNAELYTWADVQAKQGLPGAILKALRQRIIMLYRQVEQEEQEHE